MRKVVVVLQACVVVSLSAVAGEPWDTPSQSAPAGAAATCKTFVSAGLVEEERWTAANSPYCVTGPIQVSLLTIDPGVEVLVDGHHEIEVLSTITVEGTAANPIRFGVRTPGTCWAGIRFQYTPAGSSFRHCIIEDSDASGISMASAPAPILDSVLFRHNSSPTTGGAIDAPLLDSDLELRDCVFEGNTARSGGGALHVGLLAGRTLRISDSSFIENSVSSPGQTDSSRGGAIWIEAGDVVISNSRFDSNRSFAWCVQYNYGAANGAAVYFDGNGAIRVQNSVFTNNRAEAWPACSNASARGGALYVNTGSVALSHTIFSCNAAQGAYNGGAGLYVNAGSATLDNCTVARNPSGTAVAVAVGASMGIEDSIIFFNNADGVQVEGTPSILYSDVQGGFGGEGNINLNPVFSGVGCDPAELVIVAGSPCIDAGNPDPAEVDVCFPPSRGEARSDMGAHGGSGACDWVPYEVQNLRFVTRTQLEWTKSRITNTYALYRGTLSGGPWQYDHDCLNSALGTPSAQDDQVPAVGFYYLAAAKNPNGESTLGESISSRTACRGDAIATRTPRPRLNTCP